MTETETKLEAYRKALESHRKALERNDPWCGEMDEPNPTRYGLETSGEAWAAEKVRRQVMGKGANE